MGCVLYDAGYPSSWWGSPYSARQRLGGASWSRTTWKRTTRSARLAICTKKHLLSSIRCMASAFLWQQPTTSKVRRTSNALIVTSVPPSRIKWSSRYWQHATLWRILWVRSRNPPTCATPLRLVRASSVILLAVRSPSKKTPFTMHRITPKCPLSAMNVTRCTPLPARRRAFCGNRRCSRCATLAIKTWNNRSTNYDGLESAARLAGASGQSDGGAGDDAAGASRRVAALLTPDRYGSHRHPDGPGRPQP